MTDRTWTITDIDGRNPRTVTLAQYRAEIEAAKDEADKATHPEVKAMFARHRRGSIMSAAAQARARKVQA